jgi:histidyl-tRNA synthetase
MSKIGGVKGFHDVLPPQSERFTAIEARLRAVLASYGYDEIRIPIAERTELFARSLGETTDIVEKEMYSFTDRDGSSLTLRPEGTASVVRAAIEAGLAQRDQAAKLYYLGPMFRRERPQKGRTRQFHQLGAELIGRDDPLADAELVTLLTDCLAAAGAGDTRLVLNSLGDATCRPAYRQALTEFGEAHRAELCANCRERIARNPLRLLDCKEESCRQVMQAAPQLTAFLCEDCRAHFAEVERLLTAVGVHYTVDPRLVRGLDYYVRTAFEVLASNLGAQNAVAGGGRYDGLFAALGGPAIGAIGFAMGLERVLMAAADAVPVTAPEVSIIPLADAAAPPAFALARRLRLAGARTELEASGRSLKSAMRRADKLGAHFAVLIGPDELASGRATVRDLRRQADHRQALDLQMSGDELRARLARLAEATPPAGAAVGDDRG